MTREYFSKRVRHAALIGTLGASMLLSLAACGTTDSTSQPLATATTAAPAAVATDTSMPGMAEPTSAPTQPSNTDSSVAPTATTQTGTSSEAVTEVQGTLREWAIDLNQKEVPAGKVRFVVTNSGQMTHNFTILDSDGNVIARTPDFGKAQGVQTLEVDLQAGTYTIICSIPGHAARGQMTTLTVQ
jgi:uncharacterized cupredoxin-like copper-binding protein